MRYYFEESILRPLQIQKYKRVFRESNFSFIHISKVSLLLYVDSNWINPFLYFGIAKFESAAYQVPILD